MSDKEECVDDQLDKEASCSYQSTSSPVKLNNDSSSESSSTSKDGSADESSEGEENDLNIDNKLESRLKQCGLNRRNVKTIIHELLNDENVLNILKANIGETKSGLNLPEPKILRSKKKKTPDDKMEPKFTELELPEEEDDEDEEYNPENEPVMDFEDASTQDTVRSTTDLELDTSIEGTDQKSDEAMDTVTTTTAVNEDTVEPTTSTFIRDLNQIDQELQAIDQNATNLALTEDEIIAQRTRSKHSLLDIAMAEIETAFQPPDVTEDMYHPSGDTDWHKWLAELTMDDNMLPELPKEDEEDDPEKDPDYNFIESESEDIVEKEDFQDDRGTRVSKKELQELLDLLNVPDDFLTYQGEPITPTPPPVIQPLDTTRSVKHVTFSKPKATPSITSPTKVATVREQLAILKEQKDYVPMEASSAPVAPEAFVLTNKQRETLDLQMRQHIQLLCQVNLLCRNSKKLSTNVHDSHALLKEIDQLAEYNKTSMKINKSTFEVNNIKEALTIAKLNIKDSEPVTRLTKHEREKGLHPIPRCVAMLMATSGVFQFASLLPTAGAATSGGVRVIFTQHEDNILVLGLSQMEKHFVPWYILVHQYMMPTKKPEQIRSRALNANNGHYGSGNPIRRFRRTGQLPRVPPGLTPSVGEGTGLVNFLQFCDERVPDWLIALQQEVNSLAEQNLSGVTIANPRKVDIQSAAVTSASNIPSATVQSEMQIPSTAVPNAVYIQSAAVPNSINIPSTAVQNAIQIPSSALSNSIHIPSAIVTNLAPGRIVLPTIVTAPKPAPRTQFTPIRLPPAPHGSAGQNSSKKLIESIKKSFSPKKSKKVSPTKKLFHKKRGRKPKMKDLTGPQQFTTSDNVVSKKPTQSSTTNLSTAAPTPDITSVTTQHNTCDVTTDRPAIEKTVVVAEGDFPKQVAVNDVVGNSPVDEVMEVTKENDVEEIVTDEILNDDIQDADDEQMTEEDDFDEMGDTEDDEVPPSPKDGAQSGGESPHRNPSNGNARDARSDEDSLSEEEQTGNNEDPKSTKTIKKSRVRWKNNKGEDPVAWRQTKSGRISKKLGGRLHRIHPGLAGKKAGGGKSRAQEDQLSRNLRRTAEDVRLLEEDTIVQLDPTRVEKEMLFAQGYLKKMEESLKDRPELLMQVLDVLCQFDSDTSQSPSSLFIQLSNLLKEHPELLRGFAPFLLPEQAHSCGLLQEQQVYARARKFLRQLEIRFHDNPQHLNKILSAFHAVAEGSIFTEQELKSSILSLLKSDPYLQEEFLMFFDDERPPESRLHGDYEQVTWNDDLAKEVSTPYEYVYIPSAEGSDQIGVEEGPSDVTKSPSTSQLRHNKRSDVTRFGGEKGAAEAGNEAPEENNGDWEENPKSDEDTDEEEELEEVVCNIRSDPVLEEDESASLCLPTDIGVISEDALSCSPFKRHNSLSTSNSHPHDRPMTPTQSTDSLGGFPLPDHGVQGTQSSSLGSGLPTTPTGSPKDKTPSADGKTSETPASWTRECDALLLSVCKDIGPGKKAFAKASELLKRSVDETSCRFAHLMSLLAGEGDLTDDTDTTSLNSDTDGQQSDAD